MAVYNGERRLEETLDSVLTQQVVDLELIVVDDGSTDGTSDILARYGASVHVIRNRENRGLTHSLIEGCNAARGTFIARQDAGDLSLPLRLTKQAALLAERDDLLLVSPWTEFVGPDLEPLFVVKGTAAAAAGPIDLIDLSRPSGVIDGPTCHPSAMFRAAAYRAAGGYRPQFHYSQDWDLWFRIAELGKFQIVPEVLYRARVTTGSISTDAREQQMELGRLAVAALRARRAGDPEEPILARAASVTPVPTASARTHASGLYFIGEALRRNGDARARRYLLEAARSRPLDARAWVRWIQSLVTTRRLS